MQENIIKQTAVGDKQFTRNKWIFSSSGIGRDMAYQLVSTFLLTYIQFGVSLNALQFATLFGIIAIGGKIWDGINDPMMGAIIEGTHMKWGKFKPWIIIGAVGCGSIAMLMFNLHVTGWTFVIILSLLYLLWESTFTMNDIGYWSMLASMTSDIKKRNSVTMLTVLFAGVGAIIAQGVIPMVTTGNMVQGYGVVAIIVGLAYILSQIVCGVLVKEGSRTPAEREEKISLKKMLHTIKQNDQILWMTLSLLFYSIGSALLIALAANLIYSEISYDGGLYFYIVVAYGVTSVIINAVYTTMTKYMSRKKLQAIAVGVAVAGYIVLASIGWVDFLPFNIWIMVASSALISAGQSLYYMASIVNMTNCVEYNEYKSGSRNEAVISTLRPFIVKMADALKAGVVVVALIASGIYGMSQSISGLEAQKNTFAEMNNTDRIYYVEFVQDIYEELALIEVGSDEYNALLLEIDEAIQSDKLMMTTKMTATGLVDVANSSITHNATTTLLTDIGEDYFVEGDSYEMFINDSADMAFRDKVEGELGARIALRVVVAVVPIALLLVSLYIQRKKFIIDEEYYEQMLVTIETRNAEQNTAEEE